MLIGLAIIFTLLYIIWMRKYLMKMAVRLDEAALTPSDFGLMGLYMKFDSYSPKEIEKVVKEKIEEKYPGVKVEYVNPVYDIADFFKIAEKHN